MESKKQLFAEGIQALKEKNYSEAESKLKTLIDGSEDTKERRRAEIIYSSLLIRKECERLLDKVESE